MEDTRKMQRGPALWCLRADEHPDILTCRWERVVLGPNAPSPIDPSAPLPGDLVLGLRGGWERAVLLRVGPEKGSTTGPEDMASRGVKGVQ